MYLVLEDLKRSKSWEVGGGGAGLRRKSYFPHEELVRRCQEIYRREVELDLQVSPEEIMSREVELGCESWTSFASSCSSKACNGHCPYDSAQARQLKQQLRSALVAGQWRGDTALTLPLFWRRSTVSPVFFGQYPRSSLHSFVPFPSVPVSNKPLRFCGRKAKWSFQLHEAVWPSGKVDW